MRPKIGVSGPDYGGYIAWIFTWAAVSRAGGRAVRLTSRRRCTLEGLDGLILGGGEDLGDTLPSGDEPIPQYSRFARVGFRVLAPLGSVLARVRALFGRESSNIARDKLEVRLLRDALREGLPALGICRGAQLMARVEGGTLIRDVRMEHPNRPEYWTPLPVRDVCVARKSTLFAILGQAATRVNALHRHAVCDVPAPLRPVARERAYGIVQAIEATNRPYWIGVQWHPEYLVFDQCHHNLFRGLVQCARAHSANSAHMSSSAHNGDQVGADARSGCET